MNETHASLGSLVMPKTPKICPKSSREHILSLNASDSKLCTCYGVSFVLLRGRSAFPNEVIGK